MNWYAKLRWKGAGLGAVFAAIALVVALADRWVFAWFFRDPIAHLFPTSKVVWFASKGMLSPMVVSYAITLLLFAGLPMLAGYLSGLSLERKNKALAVLIVLLALALWLYAFHTLNLPMDGMSHH